MKSIICIDRDCVEFSNLPRRSGKVLVFLVVCLPMLFGMLGLVVDGSLLMAKHRQLQNVADIAATVCARELSKTESGADLMETARRVVHEDNLLPEVSVALHHPPSAGAFAGQSGYVEVILTQSLPSNFIQVVRNEDTQTIQARAVAGTEASTVGGVVAVLDLDPAPVAITGLPAGLPSLTLPAPQLGGMEVLGAGVLKVDGAILVNTEWGGLDENGDPAGKEPPLGGLRHAISCTPILPITKLRARDIRVTGGVDHPDNYGNFESGKPSPLDANRFPVPDPFVDLPVPTTSVDPSNVVDVDRGAVNILSLPLLGPPVRLSPGVYDWINIIAGNVVFEPGVYIIRNTNPLTGISLSITAGRVTADGVLFYVTDSSNYSATTGFPDANDERSPPPPAGVPSLIPSVVVNAGLLGSRFRGLDDPASPFDGLLLYQRRNLRKPIVLVSEQLVGNPKLAGTLYAKWGQVLFAAHGQYDFKFVCGSLRIVNVLECELNPTNLLPRAEDVYLVE